MLQAHRVLPFLRAFEAIARLGTVRSAAAELHLTPGAISHQLKRLEESLEISLFERNARKLVLTKQGRAFQHHVVEIFNDLDRGLYAIAASQLDEPEKSLTISVPSGFGNIWLAPRLPNIANQLGLPSIACRVARAMNHVDWRHVDLAIVYDNPPWEGCSWVALPEPRLEPICAPSQLNDLSVRHPSDLLQLRFLHEDGGGEWKRWLAAAELKNEPVRNAYFDHLSMAFQAALAGEGVALVSGFLAHEYLRNGQLVRPIDIAIPAAKRYFLITLEGWRYRPLISRAVDLLTSLAWDE